MRKIIFFDLLNTIKDCYNFKGNNGRMKMVCVCKSAE